MSEIITYTSLVSDIKKRIGEAQIKATLSANAEMIMMYWDIGNLIFNRQASQGWGANIIKRLSIEIRNELPEIKGFSERNLARMLQFSTEYSILPQAVAQLQVIDNHKDIIPQQPVAELRYNKNQGNTIMQQPVANLENSQLFLSIPWGHNILLIEKIKNIETRFWYMEQTIENGWSREVLASMIKSKSFERNGSKVNNFEFRLPNMQSELVKQTLKLVKLNYIRTLNMFIKH